MIVECAISAGVEAVVTVGYFKYNMLHILSNHQ